MTSESLERARAVSASTTERATIRIPNTTRLTQTKLGVIKMGWFSPDIEKKPYSICTFWVIDSNKNIQFERTFSSENSLEAWTMMEMAYPEEENYDFYLIKEEKFNQ
jgi:hypothetical protein